MPDNDPKLPQVPEAKTVTRKRARLSFVWIILLVAATVGA